MCSSRSKSLDERYYRHAGAVKLFRKISTQARYQLYQLFMETMRPGPDDCVLDVGVSDETSMESNMLEQLYPHRRKLTCASLTDGEAIMAAYPGISHITITAGERLPFADNQFDIVYSNAVLEHAGSWTQQREFLKELCRVAQRRFVAIPNRRFPIEHHTGLPFVHYLPKPWFRRLLRGTRYDVWSHEENLNHVAASDIGGMWPAGTRPIVVYCGVGLGCWKSNLVAYQG